MRIALAALFALSISSPANSQVWEHSYVKGKTAQQITSCNAEIVFRDGMVSVRIYGELMDIYFYQESLSVPPRTTLGNVALSFKVDTFLAEAFSLGGEGGPNTSAMIFSPMSADYGPFLNAMSAGSNMTVIFPDGSNFDIRLDRSNSALEAAASCWKSRPTGEAGHNPFVGKSGNNPFQ